MSAHESMRERSKQRQAAEAGVAARGRRRPPALAPLLLLLPLLILPAAQAEWTEAAPVALQQAQLLPPAAYRPVAWSVEEVGAMRRALLPPAAYRPVAWSAEEVAGMRRALLQRTATASGTLQLPICELDLSYRIVDLLAENFTAILTLTNNRELDLSHWQVVWRYADFPSVGLTRVEGAIPLSLGSPKGAPVRLVDAFESDGVPGGGGAYSFLAEIRLLAAPQLPPAANQSLAIEAVNINGMQCTLSGGGEMQYRECLDPASSAAALLAGGSGAEAVGSSSGTCQQTFCCGAVLLGWEPPPAPPSPPAPPAPAPAPGPSALLLPGESPPPPVQEQPPAQPRPSTKKRSSAVVPAAAGGAATAAVALAGGVVVLVCLRRRRGSKPQPEAAGGSKGEQALGCGPGGGAEVDSDSESGSSTEGASSPASFSKLPQGSLLLHSPTLGSLLSPHTGMLLRPQGSIAGAAPPTPGGRDSPPAPAGCQVSIAPTAPGDPPAKGEPLGLGQAGGSAGAAGQGGGGAACTAGGAPLGHADLAGEVVLAEQLGSGAFGTVYRGLWRGRPVAVKVLTTSCHTGSRELQSFVQEARLLSRLQHPNIVPLLAACTGEPGLLLPPSICLIEELAEGGSLHTLLHGSPGARRRRPLEYGRLLQVACNVSEAMCYLLEQRVVHRDLKPQNVLLDGAGRALVCDFGISKHKDRTFVSTAGHQAGTPAYMAPECFDGGKGVSEKVDVFAFAVLLWEMLTGEVPWRELASPMQVIFSVGVMQQRLPIPEGCPAFLRQLIEECWAECPGARPPFPAIRQRLREERARAAADAAALQARCVAAQSTTSEADALSATGFSSPGPATRSGTSSSSARVVANKGGLSGGDGGSSSSEGGGDTSNAASGRAGLPPG